jgi:xanthine dehydrogenase iron-sulfur cluster and FAD-binding subunit A
MATQPFSWSTDTIDDRIVNPAIYTDLPALLAARAAHPQAQVVAGCTDVGLWVTKQHRQYDRILDVTRAAELRQVQMRRIQQLVMAMSTDPHWRDFRDLHNAVLALETFTLMEQAWADWLGGRDD